MSKQVAARLGCSETTVGKWRRRFLRERLDGLIDEDRPGRPSSVSLDQVEDVVVATLESKPADATHWSQASMAKRTGLSRSTIGRIWRDFGLKPHRVDTFKLSTDPLFVEKVVDVVGLYHNPPERAVVLCVDEKSQIQALDRSQPVLPMMPGMPRAAHPRLPAQRHHQPVRGVQRRRRHRHQRTASPASRDRVQEVPDHDRQDRARRPGRPLICDNYGTHKTPAIKAWLAKHPRFHMHFTPTGSSWINQVERWFGFLTDQKIRRGTHKSVQALEADIRAWVKYWNDDPRPFIWTKTAEEILDSLSRYLQRVTGQTADNQLMQRTSEAGH